MSGPDAAWRASIFHRPGDEALQGHGFDYSQDYRHADGREAFPLFSVDQADTPPLVATLVFNDDGRADLYTTGVDGHWRDRVVIIATDAAS